MYLSGLNRANRALDQIALTAAQRMRFSSGRGRTRDFPKRRFSPSAATVCWAVLTIGQSGFVVRQTPAAPLPSRYERDTKAKREPRLIRTTVGERVALPIHFTPSETPGQNVSRAESEQRSHERMARSVHLPPSETRGQNVSRSAVEQRSHRSVA